MKKLKKIKIYSFGLFQAILFGWIGLLCGIIYAFGGLLIDVLVTLGLLTEEAMSTSGLSLGTVLAFGALIAMPVAFAIIGFLTGIVEALLFNLFTNCFGGIKIDFEQKE